MRLTKKYREVIKTALNEFFGKKSKIYLFGSRVYDDRKGGDIDLYIIPEGKKSLEELYDKKIKFLVEVQKKIRRAENRRYYI